ncbi:MAG: hypothetical protein QM497_09785 [Sulfurimonas sp.]
MQAITIKPQIKEINSIEIEMKANTVFSFFNSILTDEIETLQNHLIYTDANALSQKKPAYFVGEQLLLGDAFIIGRNGLEETDAYIPQTELQELLNYDVPQFYQDTLDLLSQSDVNLYRNFDVMQGSEKLSLNLEWVLYTFNIADNRTKEYFIGELTKSLQAKENTEAYIKKMAQLAINAAG